jgi:flavin reductase (DIM6/NTAB) family NADH-FMN oxidoreductase RutF
MTEVDASLRAVVEALPGGLFVMTSAYDDKRAGVIVRAVQPCSSEPLLICVASRKGHWIEPLIRDSHVFAVCQIAGDDLLARKRFAQGLTEEDQGDPFAGIGVRTLVTGAPVIDRSICALDCEVVRHFDLEADHELYIGHVVAAMRKPAPNGTGPTIP